MNYGKILAVIQILKLHNPVYLGTKENPCRAIGCIWEFSYF